MENWKDVEEYEGYYEVSNKGNVRNKRTGRVLKASSDNMGYLKVNLYKNGKGRTLHIHRLVAMAFLDNPDDKSDVDHIDTNKTNNNVNNLKWCSHKENMNNLITKERFKKANNGKKPKKVLCVNTGEVFDSTRDACRHYGITDMTSVSNAANPNQTLKYAGKLPDGTKLEWKYI